MLEKIFLQVLNMSFVGSFVILAVLLARVLLQKAPKIFSYALWAVVLLRLIFPFSFESALSMVKVNPKPIAENIGYMTEPKIDTGIKIVNESVNPILPKAVETNSINPMQVWIFIRSIVWIIGLLVLLILNTSSILKLKRKLKTADVLKDNIFISNEINTAFVMGFIKPKIFLPVGLSESEKEYVILHEETHIKRFDHIVRLISFFALSIHWFNPLVWLAYYKSGEDMEMSCDESVIKKLGKDYKKDYSSSLLNLSTGRRYSFGTSLPFGVGNIKGRVKNVLNYKEPKFWLVLIVLALILIFSISLFTNPKSDSKYDFLFGEKNLKVLWDSKDIFDGNSTRFLSVFFAPDGMSILDKYSTDLISDKEIEIYLNNLPEEDVYKNAAVAFSLIRKLNKLTYVVNREDVEKTFLVYRNDINEVLAKNSDVGIYDVSDRAKNSFEDFKGLVKDIAKTNFSENISGIEQASALYYEPISLRQYRTKYMGDNSAVGNIVNKLQFTRIGKYSGIELKSGDEKKLIVNLIGNNHNSDKEFEKAHLKLQASIIFSLVENLKEIEFNIKNEGAKTTYNLTRSEIEEVYGEIFSRSENKEDYEKLLEEFYDTYKKEGYEYGKKYEEYINLNDAIKEAVLDKTSEGHPLDGIPIESHVILKEVRPDSGSVTAYTIILFESYNIKDGVFDEKKVDGGFSGPAVFSFDIDNEGKYTLTEYWTPRDGSYYMEDIKTKFPEDIIEEVDTQKYILTLMQSNFRQLISNKHLDLDKAITDLVDKILNADKNTPEWEIQADKRDLTYFADSFFTYMLYYKQGEFTKDDVDEKKAEIYFSTAKEILKSAGENLGNNNKQVKEWWDSYLEEVKNIQYEKGDKYLQENYPLSFYILNMLR